MSSSLLEATRMISHECSAMSLIACQCEILIENIKIINARGAGVVCKLTALCEVYRTLRFCQAWYVSAFFARAIL